MTGIVSIDQIEQRIYLIRDVKVILDRDLADLYEVETKVLKRQVRRNIERFPQDFMFELSENEFDNLRCQNGTSSWGGTRFMPMVFTEQGVAMLSSVLNSTRAIQVNIQIMRVFATMRSMVNSHNDLKRKIETMERNYDEQFKIVFEAIKRLLQDEEKPVKQIGFKLKKL